jgi:hypothetical protein
LDVADIQARRAIGYPGQVNNLAIRPFCFDKLDAKWRNAANPAKK